MASQRREKWLAVPVEAFLDLMSESGCSVHGERLVFPDLPDGYRVVTVLGNWRARCIDVLVSHPSFEPVADGAEAPRLESARRRVERTAAPDPGPGADFLTWPRLELIGVPADLVAMRRALEEAAAAGWPATSYLLAEPKIVYRPEFPATESGTREAPEARYLFGDEAAVNTSGEAAADTPYLTEAPMSEQNVRTLSCDHPGCGSKYHNVAEGDHGEDAGWHHRVVFRPGPTAGSDTAAHHQHLCHAHRAEAFPDLPTPSV